MVVQRLDNVIKRAEELEGMHKSAAALDSLYDVLTPRRARSLDLAELIPAFSKFLSLAVELRRGKAIKEGLHQFKRIAVNSGDTGFNALTDAVKQLLQESADAVTKAQQQADEVQVDDLEEESPQDLLLAMVSSEEAKDRTDREVVTPWLKLQWENFRSVLDVLRNHSQLEVAYAEVASQAFDFCVKFGRKTELRRLAELLRTHLQYAATMSKHYHTDMATARAEAIEHAGSKDVTPAQIAARMPATTPQFPIDLSDANTLQRFLDTRFEQLNVAVKLELWQEAFRSVEDIHTLLTASHRPIPVNSVASYYETLARVFYVSKNHLFHAATWFRYFSMLASRRAPVNELRKIASLCVLSLLCIPRNEQEANLSSRSRRWMSLINLQKCPTRQGLIDSAVSRNVLDYCQPELCDLFKLLQEKFNPLSLREDLTKLVPGLATIPDFSSYSSQLLEVIATSVFEDLAASYTEVKLDFVLDLATLPEPFDCARSHLEYLLVRGAAHGYNVRIDHQRGVVRFVDSLSNPPLNTSDGSTVRTQLFDLAKLVLTKQEAGAGVPAFDIASAMDREASSFATRKAGERDAAKMREEAEREAEEERKRIQSLAEKEAKQAEEARAREEEIRQAEKNNEKLAAENERAEKLILAKNINNAGRTTVDLNEIDNMTVKQLESIQMEQWEKEYKSLEDRLKSTFRKIDHFERSLRMEEAKIWIEDAAQQEIRDKEAHNRRAEAILAGSRNSYEATKAYIDRLSRVRDNYNDFFSGIKSEHDEVIAKKREANNKLLEAAKAERYERELQRAKIDLQRKQESEAQAAELAKKREEQRLAAEQARAEAEKNAARSVASSADTSRASTPFGAGAGKPADVAPAASKSSPFGAGAGKPADVAPAASKSSPFGAGAGKPADVAPAASKSSLFGAGAGKPADVVSGPPKSSPFGAGAGKPAVVAPAASKSSIFGAAAGKPADVLTPTGPRAGDKPAAPSASTSAPPKKGKYVPAHLRNKNFNE